MGKRTSPLGDLGVNPHHYWSERVVLVTGAAGLLGRCVSKVLSSSGARVIGLDIDWTDRTKGWVPTQVQCLDGDVRDPSTLSSVIEEMKVNAVIHLAAQTLVGPALEDPIETFDHNIKGTWMVLEACRNSGYVESVVVASSDKAYGDGGGMPYLEEMQLMARHPYDVSKACSDMLAQTYAETFDLPVAISRCGNLYGGGDLNWSRIIPGTIRSLIGSERPVIRSDGTFVRDYLYVEDAAWGILDLAREVQEKPEMHGQALNFASEERLSVLEVVQILTKAMDSDLEPMILDEVIHEIPEQRVSSDKARRLLNWRARHSFDEGIRQTIDWYQQNGPFE